MFSRLQGTVRSVAGFVLMLLLAWFAYLAAQHLRPLLALDSYLRAQALFRIVLIAGSLGFLAAGIALIFSPLLASVLFPVNVGDQNLIRPGDPQLRYRVALDRLGGSFAAETSFGAIKTALATGAWRHDRPWRLFLLSIAGVVLFVWGLLSFLFVIGPPFMKLASLLILVYLLVRTAWAFARA
jgi:hypothetical protein